MGGPEDIRVVLEKLDHQTQLISDHGVRLSGIERSIAAIEVQDEKIGNINGKVSALWTKYDNAFAPEGTIANLRAHQAACPKEYVEAAVARQWVAIGLLATIVTGTLAKAFGLI